MGSSLRNSIHRRNHKERSQLAHRSKLGILEKHADYVKRARDYHSKQDRLTRLKQKAADRNKDEFYFSMTKEKTQGGVHLKDRGNVALPVDIVKVLKTQDENYIRTMRAAGLKKIDKIKNQLMALADLIKPGSLDHTSDDDQTEELEDEELQILRDAGVISTNGKGKGRRKPKHIVFVDSNDQARQYVKNHKRTNSDRDSGETIAQEEAVDLGWKAPETQKKSKRQKTITSSVSMDEAENEIAAEERRELSTISRRRLLKELSARLARDKQLRYTEREFEMQRLMMGKGARQKIQGAEQVEGDDAESEDEDEIDSRKGRRSLVQKVDEKAYKPRVYKWKLERKR